MLIALTTGMRIAEIFALKWSDVLYREGLIAVRSKLKGGKIRYVPMTPELATEIQRFPAVIGEDRIFPPKRGAKGERQRVEGSFETVLAAQITGGGRIHPSAQDIFDLQWTLVLSFALNRRLAQSQTLGCWESSES